MALVQEPSYAGLSLTTAAPVRSGVRIAPEIF